MHLIINVKVKVTFTIFFCLCCWERTLATYILIGTYSITTASAAAAFVVSTYLPMELDLLFMYLLTYRVVRGTYYVGTVGATYNRHN